MDQGADFTYSTPIYANSSTTTSIFINWNTTEPYDTANAQMRKSYYHTNATATFNVFLTSSELAIHLDAANTSAISPGRYVYDVEYWDSDGGIVDSAPWGSSKRIRVLEGMITVNPEVTK